jgi:predicted nucleic acid-binding protein
MIVLDTAVLSELLRPEPDPRVVAWIARQRRVDLCATAVSEAELAHGLARLPGGQRRDALTQAVARLFGEGLGGRVFPFDRAAAAVYGERAARWRDDGRPIAMAALQIAAIARARGASLLAGRDGEGLGDHGVPLVDPWRD